MVYVWNCPANSTLRPVARRSPNRSDRRSPLLRGSRGAGRAGCPATHPGPASEIGFGMFASTTSLTQTPIGVLLWGGFVAVWTEPRSSVSFWFTVYMMYQQLFGICMVDKLFLYLFDILAHFVFIFTISLKSQRFVGIPHCVESLLVGVRC